MSARWPWAVRRENSAGGVNATRAPARRSTRHARRMRPARLLTELAGYVAVPLTRTARYGVRPHGSGTRLLATPPPHLAAPPRAPPRCNDRDSLMPEAFAPALGSSEGTRPVKNGPKPPIRAYGAGARAGRTGRTHAAGRASGQPHGHHRGPLIEQGLRRIAVAALGPQVGDGLRRVGQDQRPSPRPARPPGRRRWCRSRGRPAASTTVRITLPLAAQGVGIERLSRCATRDPGVDLAERQPGPGDQAEQPGERRDAVDATGRTRARRSRRGRRRRRSRRRPRWPRTGRAARSASSRPRRRGTGTPARPPGWWSPAARPGPTAARRRPGRARPAAPGRR